MELRDGESVRQGGWTETEIARLKQLRAAGVKVSDIASRLGRTTRAVQQRACYVKITRKQTNWTKERTDQLIALAEAGNPASQIALIMGTTKNAIIGRAHRLGIKLHGKRPRYTAEAKRQWRRLYRLANHAHVRAIERKSRAKKRRAGPKPKDYKPPVYVPLPNYPLSKDQPLVDLKQNQCRFMPGDDFLCCGNETHNETAYCEHHWRLCHA